MRCNLYVWPNNRLSILNGSYVLFQVMKTSQPSCYMKIVHLPIYDVETLTSHVGEFIFSGPISTQNLHYPFLDGFLLFSTVEKDNLNKKMMVFLFYTRDYISIIMGFSLTKKKQKFFINANYVRSNYTNLKTWKNRTATYYMLFFVVDFRVFISVICED